MTKSLVINCSLNRRAKIKELLTTIRKYSECTTVLFMDVHAGYEVEKDNEGYDFRPIQPRLVQGAIRLDPLLLPYHPRFGITTPHRNP